jgi:hypothetical protein
MSVNTSVQVFISYCEQSREDAAWVEKILLPRLRTWEIEIHEFEIGRPKVSETERAIKQTKFTLLVISPNYLENNWKKYDSLLAATFNASADSWNVLPILIEKCSLPPALEPLVALDLSEPTEEKWQRLLRRILGVSSAPAGNGSVDAAPNDLMMQLKDLHERIHRLQTSIRISRPSLSKIRGYAAEMKQFLKRLRKEVLEKDSRVLHRFDKINIDHILQELKNAENKIAAGIRSNSSTQKLTCLRQTRQSLSSAGDSLRYLENVSKDRL